MIGERNHHRSAEETYRVSGADTLRAGEYLERDYVFIQFDYVRVTVSYESKVAVLDARRTYGDYVTDYRFYFCIYFLHF